MKLIQSLKDLDFTKENVLGKPIAFIPTMGALHEGHLALVRAAQKNGEFTLVSIFVNPLQFNNIDDLEKYPRTIESDLLALESVGTNAVLIPSYDELYSPGIQDIQIDLYDLGKRFEGEHRPGHFNGVIQVLFRLFMFTKPNSVYFGQKDLQQCLVVRQLLNQVFRHILFHMVPTHREVSGLAMSSRNTLLSPGDRQNASEIWKSLLLLRGNIRDFHAGRISQIEYLRGKGIETEYLNWVRLPTLENASLLDTNTQNALVFAGYIGTVRLIDNIVFDLE
ncbi:MAG: pantoate--beta-alanine ligase [Bacteroidetes bacterium]|nr:pantoate--beta-alanine ligase [Bacteroidota bacterium]